MDKNKEKSDIRISRKSRYKRNKNLKKGYKQHLSEIGGYSKRLAAWEEELKKPLNKDKRNRISDLLARLGFEPDEEGFPSGNWPTITNTDPRVYLDSLASRVSVGKDHEYVDETMEWKEDILIATSLIWAGVISYDEQQIADVAPLATPNDVMELMTFCDLDGFFNRPGFNKTPADIKKDWEEKRGIFRPNNLAHMLRRA